MRTLADKYLGGLALPEDIYKVDLAVLDRYQSYSSELLRLSLLGIAGYGFLITNVVFKAPPGSGGANLVMPHYILDYVLPFGAIVLALSAMFALGHRYFSTDCIAHYVRRIRLQKKHEGLPEGDAIRDEMIKNITDEEERLEKDLRRCKWLLIMSGVCLICGAACVAWAFAATLSSRPQASNVLHSTPLQPALTYIADPTDHAVRSALGQC
jgi:hypothetical protein